MEFVAVIKLLSCIVININILSYGQLHGVYIENNIYIQKYNTALSNESSHSFNGNYDCYSILLVK